MRAPVTTSRHYARMFGLFSGYCLQMRRPDTRITILRRAAFGPVARQILGGRLFVAKIRDGSG
jgi:hypothetical protein